MIMTKVNQRKLNDIIINDFYKSYQELINAIKKQCIILYENNNITNLQLNNLVCKDFNNNLVFDFIKSISIDINNDKVFIIEYKNSINDNDIKYLLPEILYFLTEYNELK